MKDKKETAPNPSKHMSNGDSGGFREIPEGSKEYKALERKMRKAFSDGKKENKKTSK